MQGPQATEDFSLHILDGLRGHGPMQHEVDGIDIAERARCISKLSSRRSRSRHLRPWHWVGRDSLRWEGLPSRRFPRTRAHHPTVNCRRHSGASPRHGECENPPSPVLPSRKVWVSWKRPAMRTRFFFHATLGRGPVGGVLCKGGDRALQGFINVSFPMREADKPESSLNGAHAFIQQASAEMRPARSIVTLHVIAVVGDFSLGSTGFEHDTMERCSRTLRTHGDAVAISNGPEAGHELLAQGGWRLRDGYRLGSIT